ncbi:hypothetical protein RchiOBHm_Chr6g0277171 [Rosa chinensis]|uniref:Uncharacterized protein n=1 Tax=Rosa chinensis TaxID=74649 RepID=A0A2P6PSF6_ROSCH|nr:hypothetical protein RchiOBHm_Chr6g0277171 [Rosa chinensis]
MGTFSQLQVFINGLHQENCHCHLHCIGLHEYPSMGNNERTGCRAASINLNLLQYFVGIVTQGSEELPTTTYICF